MAVLVHVGIGLAASRAASQVHVAALVFCAYVLDVIWNVLCFVGVEHYPSTGPWSHGLFMSCVWSGIGALVAWGFSRSPRTSMIVGLLIFSHWVVDFITHPMTAWIPTDLGVPVLFNEQNRVGLGLYMTKPAIYICEIGSLVVGAAIYLQAVMLREPSSRKTGFLRR